MENKGKNLLTIVYGGGLIEDSTGDQKSGDTNVCLDDTPNAVSQESLSRQTKRSKEDCIQILSGTGEPSVNNDFNSDMFNPVPQYTPRFVQGHLDIMNSNDWYHDGIIEEFNKILNHQFLSDARAFFARMLFVLTRKLTRKYFTSCK